MSATSMVVPSHVIKSIIFSLFDKEYRRLDQIKTDLIEANLTLGNPKDGFLYKGEFHTNLPISHRKDAKKKMLHPELYEQGDHYMDTRRTLEKDELRIHQILSILMQSCRTVQDARDAVPEIVVDCLPNTYQQLPRTREEGWPMVRKPLQKFQFDETAELITLYVANRMLY